MDSPKAILIKCLTLIVLERKDGVKTSPSNELVVEVLNTLPLPETTVDHDHSRQTFMDLRGVLLKLIRAVEDTFPKVPDILQQIQIACREEDYLFRAFEQVISKDFANIQDVVALVQDYRRQLLDYMNEKDIMNIISDYSRRVVFGSTSGTEMREVVVEMGEKLNPLIQKRAKHAHPAERGNIDLSDINGVLAEYETVKDKTSQVGNLRSGWKALNRMFGKYQALPRGTFWLIGGLKHNFKSGFMLSMFVQFALFNKPSLNDPTCKPLLLFISFENELSDNMLWIYKYIKENDEGILVDESKINPREAAHYVAERMSETGFEVKMIRYDPSDFTYGSLLTVLDGFIAEGYEIQALLIDYLNMISKRGIPVTVAGDAILEVFGRLRNYCSPRKITCLTPHQLSTEAQQLARDNVQDFVKVIADKQYYEACKRLGQPVDLESVIHIVPANGKSYLTIQRGKHRNMVTPAKDKYLVLPFQEIGTIPWDIDKEYDISVPSPGGVAGGVEGEEGEHPWWEQ